LAAGSRITQEKSIKLGKMAAPRQTIGLLYRVQLHIQILVRSIAVWLFGSIAKLGIHRWSILEPAFLRLYDAYKLHFEAGPIDRLREFVPVGSLVIDVGANVGFFTLRFAEWVGEHGKVISIEPEDRNYANLVSALKQRQLSGRVHTLKAVAANTAGELRLELNPLHPADHKLSRDESGVPVRAITLDDLVLEATSSRPVLVKIDVQGAEMLVLEGAARILSQAGPALFIELHEEGLNKFGTSISAILEYLRQYSYQAYWLARSGAHPIAHPELIHAKVAQVGYVDVLFLPTMEANSLETRGPI
jgi:FkbM family methyltransferase